MKKWIVLLFALFLLAACGETENGTVEENNATEDELEDQIEIDDEADSNGTDDELETKDNEVNGSEEDKTDKSQDDEVINSNGGEEVDPSEETKTTEDILVDLTYDIFAAQRDEDYDFLQSVITDGVTLDEKSNVFSFNDVAYPHEQELLNIPVEDLEYRYPHEADSETMIIGFAAIDYENESSFTIDFEYMKENGEWKMNDMDINK